MRPHLVLKVRVKFGNLQWRMATGRPTMTDAGRAYADLRWIPESWWVSRPRDAWLYAERWLIRTRQSGVTSYHRGV